LRATVKKWGNSLALRIPRSVAGDLGLRPDSTVEMMLEENRLIVSPLDKSEFSLAGLLALVTDENLHGEIETGPPTLREEW